MWCRWGFLPVVFWGFANVATAQQSAIFAGTETVTFSINGIEYQIQRNGSACPPACLTAQEPAMGVTPMAELELIAFLQGPVSAGMGLLIDTRLPAEFRDGAIPGAINIPHPTLAPDNPFRREIFKALGAVQKDAGWDFSASKTLALYCDGPSCPFAAAAIRDLVGAGYPAARLHYYRGGVQSWTEQGLNLDRGAG